MQQSLDVTHRLIFRRLYVCVAWLRVQLELDANKVDLRWIVEKLTALSNYYFIAVGYNSSLSAPFPLKRRRQQCRSPRPPSFGSNAAHSSGLQRSWTLTKISMPRSAMRSRKRRGSLNTSSNSSTRTDSKFSYSNSSFELTSTKQSWHLLRTPYVVWPQKYLLQWVPIRR